MIRPWWCGRRAGKRREEIERDAATRREAEFTLEVVDALAAKLAEQDRRNHFAEAVERSMRRKYGTT
ncbi:DUF7620 family protein [Mycobacteroides abscessus]|uniref:DUF7620 family protein n=1 Tax=Mycobacteroides abscessus TaxID=36809 RepID=UPI00092C857F|nr:hypothetical protein [Mycobacteroides abscessus]OTR12585.1 hypothetical protein B9M83_01340 [Mycobacteroides abscessus]OTR19118.1 hypothetical protein B9M82_01260 [Mycobacteroides abscessus]SIH59131.1 Uncharacterised protein [Mycobacteroides abscessus subsp. abscessus]SIN10473.1 Uncharacterised protein [Mycobacteroides abscessus subsp. abscessus]SIN11810.1 Uncharacterised protein [Mycobacteroides abscessus subsp. abscessus]